MFETFRFRKPTGSSRSRCEGHQRKTALPASRIPGMAVEKDQRQPPHLHKRRDRCPNLGAGSRQHGLETRSAETSDEDRTDRRFGSVVSGRSKLDPPRELSGVRLARPHPAVVHAGGRAPHSGGRSRPAAARSGTSRSYSRAGVRDHHLRGSRRVPLRLRIAASVALGPGDGTAPKVVLRAKRRNLSALPYDLLQTGRQLSFGLGACAAENIAASQRACTLPEIGFSTAISHFRALQGAEID